MPSYEVSSQEANNLNLNNIIEDDLREDALARAAANRALNANTMPASSFPTGSESADGSPPAVVTPSTIPMALPAATSGSYVAAVLSTRPSVPPTRPADGSAATQVPPTTHVHDSVYPPLTGLRARQLDGSSPVDASLFAGMASDPEDATDD